MSHLCVYPFLPFPASWPRAAGAVRPAYADPLDASCQMLAPPAPVCANVLCSLLSGVPLVPTLDHGGYAVSRTFC